MVEASLIVSPSNSVPNFLSVIDYPTLVALGLVPNAVHGHQAGENINIPSSVFIVLSNVTSASFPNNFPPVPQQMQLVSSSPNDNAVGTGGQQIKLVYLRSPTSSQGYTINTEFITMNGLAPVLTVNTDIFRIESIEISKVGTSGGAVGNISLQSIGGVTTFERIDATRRINKTCVHFVPKGYKSVLYGVTLGSSTLGGTSFLIRGSVQYQGNNVVSHAIDELEMGNISLHYNLIPPEVVSNPDGLDMYYVVAVIGHASNQTAKATIHFIDNPI